MGNKGGRRERELINERARVLGSFLFFFSSVFFFFFFTKKGNQIFSNS